MTRPLLLSASLALTLGLAAAAATGLAADAPAAVTVDPVAETQGFLDFYTAAVTDLYAVSAEAAWKASTDVKDAHTAASVAADQALAALTGNPYVIRRTQELLKHRDRLRPLQVLQLDRIILSAAENPGTLPEVAKRRIEAEGRQRQVLDGFEFTMTDAQGAAKKVNPNDIDETLQGSTDLAERLRAWEASKAVGPALKDGLVELRGLRNQVAREMGHGSFFSMKVSEYRATTPELMAMMDRIIEDVRPLYTQLHCYAKYRLAKRYGQPVPKRIPAHWIGNRWAQEWPGLAPGVDLDPLFASMPPEKIVKQAEALYVSMGFPPLPASFWEKSDLWDLPADAERKKNRHASAWHMDLRDDVRSLMSVRSDFDWFQTTNHELGHIYYYIAYSTPEVPPLLREGANRAFHEAVGDLVGMAGSSPEYLRQIGVLDKKAKIDRNAWLLADAMNSVVFLPFAAGTMAHFERDLYEEELPPDQFNARWWDYVRRYQGVEPPSQRGEDLCDACTKTHINDDPAGYYDYALASVIRFQLHDHIARKILKKDPRDASYYGNAEAGAFIQRILALGGTRDWREVLREATGEDLSGRAMLEYYAPLQKWLEKQNKGCDCSI